MKGREKAISCMSEGFNCCQAVLSAYAPDLGLDRETALKVAGAFGGGIAGMGETCGAVTGALMAIGLKHGTTDARDQAAQARIHESAQTFIRQFTNVCGSIKCRDLLHCDIGTPEGMERAQSLGLFRTFCPELVGHSARILEDLL
jgi:C_GCAxxG_C_C family probable redox protein